MFTKIAKLTNKAVGSVKSVVQGSGQGNERNNETVQEMKLFKEHVKLLVRELQDCSLKLQNTTTVVSKVLGQQLPRVYMMSAAGATTVEAADPETKMVGAGVNLDALQAAALDMVNKVSIEVVKPLEDWLTNFTQIKDRNHKCEDMAQQLVVQRKVAAAAEESAKDLAAKGHKNAEAAAQKAKTEAEKEAKMQEEFTALEAEIFNEMQKCVSDIYSLRQYALIALQAMQTCFTQIMSAFGSATPLTAVLPGGAAPPRPGLPDHGSMRPEGSLFNPFQGGHTPGGAPGGPSSGGSGYLPTAPPAPGAPPPYPGAPAPYPGGPVPYPGPAPPPYPGASPPSYSSPQMPPGDGGYGASTWPGAPQGGTYPTVPK